MPGSQASLKLIAGGLRERSTCRSSGWRWRSLSAYSSGWSAGGAIGTCLLAAALPASARMGYPDCSAALLAGLSQAFANPVPFTLGFVGQRASAGEDVAVASAILARKFGSSGVVLTSGLSGIVDVDGASLSALRLAGNVIPLSTAAEGILLAILLNAAMRVVAAFAIGPRRYLVLLLAAALEATCAGMLALAFSPAFSGPFLICRKERCAAAWLDPRHISRLSTTMMGNIATLMVVVDGDHPSDTYLAEIGILAAELGARIIGVTACEHTPSFYFAAGAVATNLLEEEAGHMKERMAAAEERCRKVIENTHSITWRSAIDLPINFVLRESRAADLLVCFPRKSAPLYSDVEAGELVLKSGRPVLAIPADAKWHPPERILIGWKDSRESRRAVLDALPFLRRARKVSIVEIVENEEGPKWAEARLRDVASWLKSHAIEALPRVITPGGDPLDAFAGAVREFQPDWVVAGAYGHSRLGEWIFGGVTRYLLTQSDRPVFLSH